MTSFGKKAGLLALCVASLFMTGCAAPDFTSGTYADAIYSGGIGVQGEPLCCLPGTYVGTIYSGGVVPVVTTFYPQPPDEQKQMAGIFMYLEENNWVTGLLSHCQQHPERRITCQWHDKYGSGIMDVRFDESHDTFDGRWGTCRGTRSDLIWNGKRQRPTSANKP